MQNKNYKQMFPPGILCCHYFREFSMSLKYPVSFFILVLCWTTEIFTYCTSLTSMLAGFYHSHIHSKNITFVLICSNNNTIEN